MIEQKYLKDSVHIQVIEDFYYIRGNIRHKFNEKVDYVIKKIGFWLANAPTRQARLQ
jgi:hypothetical protein